MAVKFIAPGLGDLSGQAGKPVRCNAGEKRLEFYAAASGADLDRCCVTKSVDQSIPVTTWTDLTFDQEQYDTNGMHDNVTNNTRITIQEDGEYRITYHVLHDAMDQKTFWAKVDKNGVLLSGYTQDIRVGSKDSSHEVVKLNSFLYTLSAGDYLELQVYHDNVAAKNVLAVYTFFEVYRVI